MELRHLRYFVAVAEEGSLTVAAEKRLHTAQPSLSRQMRDLEVELGVTLMVRGARGIELTPAGKVFLDHARMALMQVEAGTAAARRAAEPAKVSFAVGFLTGYEMEWLPALMGILRDELPNTEVMIQSSDSPPLAAALMRGKIDLAFLRPEKQTSGLIYTLLRREPLVVVMPADHALAVQDSVRPQDIIGEVLVGVPTTNAPVLREVTDRYGAELGIDLTPDHEVDNLSMAISLVASTRGLCLLPFNAKNFLPPSVVSRPIQGAAPMIDLVLAYNKANTSPLLKFLISKSEDLKVRVSRTHPAWAPSTALPTSSMT
jgi:LysR family hca operon transcriptional activator